MGKLDIASVTTAGLDGTGRGRIAFVTGANGGIGKDVARQLALSNQYGKVYLGCRNEQKAMEAKRDLERLTQKSVFEVLKLDVSDSDSVHAAVKTIKEPIDALILNAGGICGKTPLALTKQGVTTIFATNVLGHVVLTEELISADKLTTVAILVGSEAARGIPGVKRPSFHTHSVDEFASMCDGRYFQTHAKDVMLAYAQVKYIGAMWAAVVARRNPKLRILTVSPGNTDGTNAPKDLPWPMPTVMKVAIPVLGALGMMHTVDVGAKRIVDSTIDGSLRSGAFYGSVANKITGPMIDQSEIWSELSNTAFQDNA